MSLYHLLSLRYKQLPVIIQHSIQLVQQNPIAMPHHLRQQALLEHQLPGRLDHIAAYILLQVCMIVVIDPDEHITRSLCQPLDQTRLTNRRVVLDKTRQLSTTNSHKPLQVLLDRLGEDIAGRLTRRNFVAALQDPVLLHFHILQLLAEVVQHLGLGLLPQDLGDHLRLG